MSGKTAITPWATAFAMSMAMPAGLFAPPAAAEQFRISTDAMYRDMAQFEFGPNADSPHGDRRARTTWHGPHGSRSADRLAQKPDTGETTPNQASDTPSQSPPQTQRQPDKPPEAVPRYKDGVYIINTDYWLDYPRNLWRFFSAPARFDETDWFIAVAAGTTVAAMIALDDEFQAFWQGNITGGTSRGVFDVFNVFGGPRFQISTIVGGYALAELVDQTGLMDVKRGKSAFILSAQSAVLTQLLVGGFKYISGRERPEKGGDPDEFNGPGSGNNTSFPSGHASAAFAFAGTISEVYQRDYPWVPWVLYPLATGTALARVDRDKHWASDVFVGGLVGYLVAATVVRYSPFLEKNNLSFRPIGIDDGSGVALVRKF